MNILFATTLSLLILTIVMASSSKAEETSVVGQQPDPCSSADSGERACAGTATTTAPQPSATRSFGPVTRLHVRVGDEDGSVLFGGFMFLPYDSNFAGLVELDGEDGDWHVGGEAKFERPFVPQSPWGRAVGPVVRLQASDLYESTWAIGLQWNVSDTPGIIENTKNIRWKSLFQVFVKSRAEYAGDETGLVDFYHWYQFPINDWLYLRGVNTYYQVKMVPDYYNLMQEYIHPLWKDSESFLHLEYRSADFMGKSKGFHYALGLRFSLW
jgi:hypothetical protein